MNGVVYCNHYDSIGIEVSLLNTPLRISIGIITILVNVDTLTISLKRVAQKNPTELPTAAMVIDMITIINDNLRYLIK